MTSTTSTTPATSIQQDQANRLRDLADVAALAPTSARLYQPTFSVFCTTAQDAKHWIAQLTEPKLTIQAGYTHRVQINGRLCGFECTLFLSDDAAGVEAPPTPDLIVAPWLTAEVAS